MVTVLIGGGGLPLFFIRLRLRVICFVHVLKQHFGNKGRICGKILTFSAFFQSFLGGDENVFLLEMTTPSCLGFLAVHQAPLANFLGTPLACIVC